MKIITAVQYCRQVAPAERYRSYPEEVGDGEILKRLAPFSTSSAIPLTCFLIFFDNFRFLAP